MVAGLSLPGTNASASKAGAGYPSRTGMVSTDGGAAAQPHYRPCRVTGSAGGRVTAHDPHLAPVPLSPARCGRGGEAVRLGDSTTSRSLKRETPETTFIPRGRAAP